MTSSDAVAAYLDRVGLPAGLEPTLESLVALHHAHLDAVPYENLSTVLGRPPSVDPEDCLDRIARVGRAGYCFHQNGALEVVLRELGYAVTRRHAHVWSQDEDRWDPALNHLALVVHDPPGPADPGGDWWVDTGLGDAFRDPVALVEGPFEQGGFSYALTEVRADGWSFRADKFGSFVGIEVGPSRIDQAAVDAAHRHLTTPPDGAFTRLVVVQRRTGGAADTVRGCLWTHVEPGDVRVETELATYDAWRAVITDDLGLPLDGLGEDELRALHAAQWRLHQEWRGR